MQKQGLMIMLLMGVVLPFIILFLNHNIFFILISFILLVSSVLNIHSRISGRQMLYSDDKEAEAEMMEEMQDQINLDLEKFSRGTRVSRHSVAVVFFTYSSFYVQSILLNVLISLIMVYWINKIFEDIMGDGSVLVFADKGTLRDIVVITVSSASVFVIVAVSLIKFSSLII